MQSVILAGGLGTRLWPLTKTVPKPMVPIRGIPYLEYQLRLLKRQGLVDIVILTGHLSEQIEQYFADGSSLGIHIRYSRETTPLGTGGALREARSLLAETFIVIYGDSYLPIEYRAAAERLQSCSATGLIVVYADETGETSVLPNVAMGEDGVITKYDKRRSGDPDLRYIEAGVLAFRSSVIDLMPASGPVSLENEIYPRLIAQRTLVGMPTRTRFWDIGTPERLRAIEELLA